MIVDIQIIKRIPLNIEVLEQYFSVCHDNILRHLTKRKKIIYIHIKRGKGG